MNFIVGIFPKASDETIYIYIYLVQIYTYCSTSLTSGENFVLGTGRLQLRDVWQEADLDTVAEASRIVITVYLVPNQNQIDQGVQRFKVHSNISRSIIERLLHA